MTYFKDPHALGIQGSPADPGSPLAQQIGYPSPAATVLAGLTTTINQPAVAGQGAKPPSLPWVTLGNLSPFAITVMQARFLVTIMPYTIDKFQVSPTTRTGITITPILPVNFLVPAGGTTELAGPSGAYATWFETEPVGTFPMAIGPSFPPTAQMISQITVGNLSAGPYVINVTTEPWMQTMAVRLIQTGGTANGWAMDVVDQMFIGSDPDMAKMLMGAGQWVYVPINGMLPQITITNLLNGAAGGTLSGQIMVHGLAGPSYIPRNGPLAIAGVPVTRLGQKIQTNALAGTTVPLIATPPTGACVRIRSVNVQVGAAVAANTPLLLLGTVSVVQYWRQLNVAATLVNLADPASWLVADSGLIDPTEGLTFSNGTAQTATCSVRFDVIPYPYGTEGP
jgi:hypothetical protein